ncbi:MAG TPA: STT3 domain-containing protein [archaeon]|jgi:asparagine N-glycosylation enzyme membrane subunit Stt3|nr:STT3 domain-containing protein [archaeon]
MKKIKHFFSKHWLIILIAVLIFVLGLAIRAHILRYDYMFEYDPYWHLRATGYVVQGDLPTNDPLGFYQQGGTNYGIWPNFLWFFTAAVYTITTFGAAYDKWLLMEYARWLPAIFGALISVAMFFLGTKMYNTRTGVAMGVMAATVPAFVYRTMGGFFEEDSLGFLWLVLGFIFLVMAIQNRHKLKNWLISSIVGAFFFFLMAITWDMFLLIPLVLLAYFGTMLVYMLIKKINKKEILAFSKVFLTCFLLFTIITTAYSGTGWIKRTSEYVTNYLPISTDNIDRINKENVAAEDVIGATVGEENTGKQFFLEKYSLLVVIPFLALLIIPLYLIFGKYKNKEKENEDYKHDNIDYFVLIIFFWILITGFMAWTKLKFTYTLGLPIAAGFGFLFFLATEKLQHRALAYKRTLTIISAIFLIGAIAAGSFFVMSKVPPIDEAKDWQNAMFWVKDNSSADAKIFNWWDSGHWIAYFTERKVSTDNTNASAEATSDFGMFLISEDLNFSKGMLKKYDADYFMVESSYLTRMSSFAIYGYWTTNFSDPRVTKYYGLGLGCSKVVTPISGAVSYNCQGNVLPEAEMAKIKTEYHTAPDQIMQGMPVYLYKEKDNSRIYLINAAINKTIFARVWFNDPTVEPFIELSYSSGDVRVYSVNKDKLN